MKPHPKARSVSCGNTKDLAARSPDQLAKELCEEMIQNLKANVAGRALDKDAARRLALDELAAYDQEIEI